MPGYREAENAAKRYGAGDLWRPCVVARIVTPLREVHDDIVNPLRETGEDDAGSGRPGGEAQDT